MSMSVMCRGLVQLPVMTAILLVASGSLFAQGQGSHANNFLIVPGSADDIPPLNSDATSLINTPGYGEIIFHENFEHYRAMTVPGGSVPDRQWQKIGPAPFHQILHPGNAWDSFGASYPGGPGTSPAWKVNYTRDGSDPEGGLGPDPRSEAPKPARSDAGAPSNRLSRHVMGKVAANLRWRNPGTLDHVGPYPHALVTPAFFPYRPAPPQGEDLGSISPMIIEWDMAIDILGENSAEPFALSVWMIDASMGAPTSTLLKTYWFRTRQDVQHFALMVESATGFALIRTGQLRVALVAHHWSSATLPATYDWWIDNIKVSWRMDRVPEFSQPQAHFAWRSMAYNPAVHPTTRFDKLEDHYLFGMPYSIFECQTNNNLMLGTQLWVTGAGGAGNSPLGWQPDETFRFHTYAHDQDYALSVDGPDEDNYHIQVDEGVPIQVEINPHPGASNILPPTDADWDRLVVELYRVRLEHEEPSGGGEYEIFYPPFAPPESGEPDEPGEDGEGGSEGEGGGGGDPDDPSDGGQLPDYWVAHAGRFDLVSYDDGLRDNPVDLGNRSGMLRMVNGQSNSAETYAIRIYTITSHDPNPSIVGVPHRVHYQMLVSRGLADYYGDPTLDAFETTSPNGNPVGTPPWGGVPCNDSRESAAEFPVIAPAVPPALPLNLTIDAALHPGDVDYYRMEVAPEYGFMARVDVLGRSARPHFGTPPNTSSVALWPCTIQDELEVRLIRLDDFVFAPDGNSRVVDRDETFVEWSGGGAPNAPKAALVRHSTHPFSVYPFNSVYFLRVSRKWQHTRSDPDVAIAYQLNIDGRVSVHLAQPQARPFVPPDVSLALSYTSGFVSLPYSPNSQSRQDSVGTVGYTPVGAALQHSWHNAARDVTYLMTFTQPPPSGNGTPIHFNFLTLDALDPALVDMPNRDLLYVIEAITVPTQPSVGSFSIGTSLVSLARPWVSVTWTPPLAFPSSGEVISFGFRVRNLQYDRLATPDDTVCRVLVSVRMGPLLIRIDQNRRVGPYVPGTNTWGVAEWTPNSNPLFAPVMTPSFSVFGFIDPISPGFTVQSLARGGVGGWGLFAQSLSTSYATHVFGIPITLSRREILSGSPYGPALIPGERIECAITSELSVGGQTGWPSYVWRHWQGGAPALDQFLKAPISSALVPNGGGRPSGSDVADVDGDGFVDLVIGYAFATSPPFSPYRIEVLWGDGSGTFGAAGTGTVLTGSGFLGGPRAIDLDRTDGSIDIVATSSVSAPLFWRHLGGRVFSGPAVLDGGGTITSSLGCDAGDFNGDGRLDVLIYGANFVASSGLPAHTVILVNDTANGGLFLPPVFIPNSNVWGNACIGDFNNDGRLDFCRTHSVYYNPPSKVFLGNGDGTFGAPVAFGTPPGPGGATGQGIHVWQVLSGNVGGSGASDTIEILGGNTSPYCAAVWLDSLGSAPVYVPLALAPMANRGVLCDLNGDGLLDLALSIGSWGSSLHVRVLFNTGNASDPFGTAITADYQVPVLDSFHQVAQIHAIEATSSDGDQTVDLVLVEQWGSTLPPGTGLGSQVTVLPK